MQRSFLRMAVDLAVENVLSGSGGPFGALIVKDQQVIASAANQVTALNDPTAHAEIVAIRHAAQALHTFDLQGCELYASCEPCPMCLGAVYWARLDRIYFAAASADAAAAGFDDSRFYQEICAPHERRSIPVVHLALPDSLAPFEAWTQSPLRIPY